MERRRYLQAGFKLRGADGWNCRIQKRTGSGGTSLTYFGEEEIEGQESVPVYLKELYPAGEEFVRREDGKVEAETFWGKWVLLELEENFQREQRMGNQILKKRISGIYPMTKLIRDERTGNLYGVTYQCPPSVSLKELVEGTKEESEGQISLAGKVRTMLAVCEPIRQMHAQGFCHNDVSPGNILILGASRISEQKSICEKRPQAGIIDFACAGRMRNVWPEDADVRAGDADAWPEQSLGISGSFLTDGFSAPELYGDVNRAGEDRNTASADVYSVAACFWYFLTGEPPYDGSDRECLEECLFHHELYSLSGELKAAHGKNPMEVPPELLEKMHAFFEGGLAPREYRFESMDMVIQSLSEILAMIEGACVPERELWEGVRKQYLFMRRSCRLSYKIDKELLPLAVKADREGDEKKPRRISALLREWESSFLIGEGGEGKTTTLLWMMDNLCREENETIAVYIEMNRIPENAREGFLERYLAGFLAGAPGSFLDSEELMTAAIRRRLFRKSAGGYRYLILLDGLNEMTFSDEEERKRFLDQLNQFLTKARNVKFIIAGRTDEQGLDGSLKRLYLKGLSDETVRTYLDNEKTEGKEEQGCTETGQGSQAALWTVLHTPFFLTLYAGLSDREKVAGAGGILRRHFYEKMETLDGRGEYGEQHITEDKFRDQLYCDGVSMKMARRFAMDFVLPELGRAMAGGNFYYLEKRELLWLMEFCLMHMGAEHAMGQELEAGKSFSPGPYVPGCVALSEEMGSDRMFTAKGEFRYDELIQENDDIGFQAFEEALKNSVPFEEAMKKLKQEDTRKEAGLLGYRVDAVQLADRLSAAGADRLLGLVTEQVGILTENGAGLYGFYHQHIRDYFAAVSLVNHLMAVPVLDADSGARLMDIYFDRRIWPENVLKFAGECLGLPLETPYFDGERWRRGENENPAMKHVLNLLRTPGIFSEKLKRRREKRKYTFGMAEKNLLEMYRLCCRNGEWADLSGLDLSELDLRGICFTDVIWSRPDPLRGTEGYRDRGLYTDFTGAEYAPELLFGKSAPERIVKVICHPREPVLLIEKETWRISPSWQGMTSRPLPSSVRREPEIPDFYEKETGFCLEERNLKDGTLRIYEEFSPDYIRRFGYSEDGRFIWYQGGAGGREIVSIERITGKKDRMELEDGEFLTVGLLSGSRLGMALMHDRNRISIASMDIALLNRGVYQVDIEPVRVKLSDSGLQASLTAQILDEERMLVSDGVGIWQLGTGKIPSRLLFSMKEWTERPPYQPKLSWTADRDTGKVYLLACVDQETTVFLSIDSESGERTVIREFPEYPCSPFPNLFRPQIRELHMADGKVVLCFEGAMYLWNPREEPEDFVKYEIGCPQNGRIYVSCGGELAVWWDDVYEPEVKDSRFTRWLEVFSLKDGTPLYRRWAEKQEYPDGDVFWQAACRETVWPPEAPAGKEGIRSLLDRKTGRLYFYRQDEKETWNCCGFSIIEEDCSHVQAIFADWEDSTLYVLDQEVIWEANLYSGKRKRTDEFSEK